MSFATQRDDTSFTAAQSAPATAAPGPHDPGEPNEALPRPRPRRRRRLRRGQTAFAATLDLTSTTLGAGDKAVTSCNTTAAVSYTTAFATGSYKVDTTPITTGTGTTCATKSFKVTLTGTAGSLGERTGVLGADGTATPTFGSTIPAASVTGVSVVISG